MLDQTLPPRFRHDNLTRFITTLVDAPEFQLFDENKCFPDSALTPNTYSPCLLYDHKGQVQWQSAWHRAPFSLSS